MLALYVIYIFIIAQRAGVCSHYGNDRCAGVSHVNFQMASLARLIAHEAMHP